MGGIYPHSIGWLTGVTIVLAVIYPHSIGWLTGVTTVPGEFTCILLYSWLEYLQY